MPTAAPRIPNPPPLGRITHRAAGERGDPEVVLERLGERSERIGEPPSVYEWWAVPSTGTASERRQI